jgi:sialic acid synthase SpsE
MVRNNPIIVAEFSINHLGMVNIAKKMVDSAVSSGANLIKLKFKNVDKYYKKDNKTWRNLNFKIYRNSLELSKEDFIELSKYCKEKGVDWFSTVHDLESLEFIKSLNPIYYKVASMDTSNTKLVNKVIETCKKENKPLIISLGGRDKNFTDDLVNKIKNAKIKAFLLHTVSIYPTPVGKSNINYINELKKLYENEDIKIGYSGHEVGFSASITAVMFGISMIERHFTLSRQYKIHHIQAALTPKEFKQMTLQIDNINQELNSPVIIF